MIWLIPFGALLIAMAFIFNRFAVDIAASLRQDPTPAKPATSGDERKPAGSAIAFGVVGLGFIVAGIIGALLGH